jgi:hypothetical protein
MDNTDTLDQQSDVDTQDQSNDQQSQDQSNQQQDNQWYSGLSDDLRNNPTVQKYKSQEDQVKAHLELQSVMGNDKVPIPKDENDAIAIATFNKALGIPEKAEDYKLGEVKDVEGFENMSFGNERFQEVAHKHGLTPKQAEGLRNDYIEMLGGIQNQSKEEYIAQVNKAKSELTSEWGLKYDSNIALAQSVMNKFTNSKEEFDHINALVGNDPLALKWMATIGGQFKEGSLGDLGQPAPGFTKTPSEANEEYERIMADKQDIYWAGTGPGTKDGVPESARQERIKYVEGLLKQINAGKGNS